MKKLIRPLLLLIFLGIFCYAGYNLLKTALSYRQATNFYDATAESFVTYAAEDEAAQNTAVQKVLPADGGPAIYVKDDGTEAAPIEIDFDALLATNGDVIGWLYSEGTPINYPVVQTGDNDYYLHRMLDGSYSSNGTVFMDYLCNADLTSGNTLLYGHNMKDGSMFHSLVGYYEQEYYEEHPILYYLTPEQNYRIDVLAGVTVAADGWPYIVEFGSETEKSEFLQQASAESTFEARIKAETGDTVISLSTCTYEFDNARYVVMGILTPIE